MKHRVSNLRTLGSTYADADGDFTLSYKKPNKDAAVTHIDASVNPPIVTMYGREHGARSGLR